MISASVLSVMRDFNSLRAEVDWDYSLENYIESRGSAELAVAFSALFWPPLIELNGCVLRADGLSRERFTEWWSRTSGSREQVERALNHLHVSDLFPNEREIPEALLQYLARTLTTTWEARLHQEYPDRSFVVECDLSKGAAPALLFYEIRE